MAPRRTQETYYDVLKTDPRATIAEIVAAYHSAKNAFSKDSVATYSLFTSDEANSIIANLDEAYHVLSNIDRKRAYDEELKRLREENGEPDTSPTTRGTQPPLRAPKNMGSSAKESFEDPAARANFQQLPGYEAYTGGTWKEIRERRGFSVDEVSRITKIPSRAVNAIEAEDLKALPARVYLQGFLRNLASVYRIDSKEALPSYLKRIDELTKAQPS